MGVITDIDYNTYPKQSGYVGRTVDVIFNYDRSKMIERVVVREDVGKPYTMIIKLNDGRYVLSSECQYRVR